MKILVTGGAGFIGSHLCEELVKNSHQVTSLDNYSTGSTKNHIEGVIYIKGDTEDIFKLIKDIPDLVFHLGEYPRVEQSFNDLSKVWSSNKIGTFEVLNFCVIHKVKIVYAGSSTKFGDDGLARDASPYGWTKATNTELVVNFGKWFGLNYAITYFYNVYGGREISVGNYATVIGIFVQQYKDGVPLTVVSPGTQIRNFTHIDDIVEGLILVGEKGEGDNFGIGCSKGFSVIDIAKYFGREIVMVPQRKGNRLNSKVMCGKTKELGWCDTHSLYDYLDEIIKKYG